MKSPEQQELNEKLEDAASQLSELRALKAKLSLIRDGLRTVHKENNFTFGEFPNELRKSLHYAELALTDVEINIYRAQRVFYNLLAYGTKDAPKD